MSAPSKRKQQKPAKIPSQNCAITTEVQSLKKFEGPLPSPETFIEYRAVKTDLPEIIINEWLKEGETRRTYARSFQAREAVKIAITDIFALGMLAIAGWLAYKEQYALACGVVVSPLAAKILGNLTLK